MAQATATVKVPDIFFQGGIVGDAFHGTMVDSVALIERDGFEPSEGIDDWYGPGVYFFEGDYAAARDFVVGKMQREGLQGQPVVIHAEVDLGRVFHINLIDKQVKFACASLASQLGRKEIPDRAVYKLVCEQLREEGKIDSLRIVRQSRKGGHKQHAVAIFLVVFDPKGRIEIQKVHQPCVDPLERKMTVTLSA